MTNYKSRCILSCLSFYCYALFIFGHKVFCVFVYNIGCAVHNQAFSFETGHFWPVSMARLVGVCTGHKVPAQPPTSKPLSPRLAAPFPHMARLWPACLM